MRIPFAGISRETTNVRGPGEIPTLSLMVEVELGETIRDLLQSTRYTRIETSVLLKLHFESSRINTQLLTAAQQHRNSKILLLGHSS
ncbi:hypothetical protein KC19_12G118500 [Ceratodon purpureus]|uniref:Uncharacterized protein n=1 Tax=Ceratodon purpureus TaxID=3225 RepID=A0A8T0GC05_CERPU|nr:hypothetical protein KC19_12G118500 [Ceratodon purpureus]